MKINLQQKEAIEHGSGPLLIVAGAGTGKTTVITQRLAYLIKKKKAAPDEILALTFTEKAAEEMEERVDILLPYGYVDLWVSTFHSFAERVLKDHAIDIGLDPAFKLLNQTEQWRLIRQNLDHFALDYYKPLGNPTRFIYAFIKVFSRAKDENVSPDDFIKYARKLKKEDKDKEEGERILEIAKAYKVYENLLEEKGFLDFGDLIIKTLYLFKKRKNILEKYRRQFKYILVDEFQDTNYAQYELIKLLAAPKNNLTVVGDDDQAIYKFRGASLSNIIEFKRDFPEAKEIVLTKNYRNPQNILDLSYKFIQLNNPNRLEAKINQRKKSLKLKITKKLESQTREKGIIEHLHFKSQDDEAMGVVEKIIELKEKNSSLSWNDFAILVRANDQANLFINVLEHRGIPYQFVANRGLFQKPEIINLISYLKLLDNYHESPAMYRVLSMPIFSLETVDLMYLTEYSRRKNISLFETLQKVGNIEKISPITKKTVGKILAMIERHTKIGQEKGVLKALFSFIKDSGYLQYLSKKKDQETAEEIQNINQFFKVAEEFERLNNDKSVKNFIQELEVSIEAGDEGELGERDIEEGPESVKVMTIHQAKGLEFSYVFIVNLVDKRFPSIDRKDPIELPEPLIKEILPAGDVHLQEERRLFYVAMTRAKKGLFFTSAEDYGGSRKKKFSRFLYEIGLVAKEERQKKKPIQQAIPFTQLTPANKRKGVKKKVLNILPRKFSFTQIKAFETCPYQYRFAHILHVPIKGKGTFSFGKTIHKTLYDFYKKIQAGEKPDEKELLKIYERNWIDEWYDSKLVEEQRKEKGRQALREFYRLNKGSFKAPKFLEQGFNIKIGKYTIKGFIDRVDEISREEVEIIDYKTGNLPTSNKDIDFEQLLIYALASQEVFKLKPVKLTFYYIEDNKKFTIVPDKEKIIQVRERVVETIDEITKSDFPPAPSKYKCRHCDFKEICEFRIL